MTHPGVHGVEEGITCLSYTHLTLQAVAMVILPPEVWLEEGLS